MSDPNHPLQNRAIQNMYSPGSVFKVFLAYGALASGEVDPDATVYCPGYAVYYGRAFRCHRRGGHGSVNLRDAIKVSCDVYFYALGRRLGVDGIARIARAFGFGEATGLDLAHEKPGLVPSEEWARTKRRARWYPSETISVAIGQGPVLVTPLQVARALAGLVEGGRLPDAAPLLCVAGPPHGRPASLRGAAEAVARARPDPPRDREERHVGGRERAGGHRVRFPRPGARRRRQDRHGPGRGPGCGAARRRGPPSPPGPCVVRRLRPDGRPEDRRRRLRRARRARHRAPRRRSPDSCSPSISGFRSSSARASPASCRPRPPPRLPPVRRGEVSP